MNDKELYDALKFMQKHADFKTSFAETLCNDFCAWYEHHRPFTEKQRRAAEKLISQYSKMGE